jgi:N-acetylneuraminic acid mutarotase
VCANPSASVTDGGTWSQGRPIPTLRGETKAIALAGRIYMPGGLLPAWKASTAFEVYDPATGQWAERAALPMALHHIGLAAMGERIYVTGGYSDDFYPNVNAAWVYHSDSDAWQRLADMPGHRAGHMLVAIGGKLYVAGGDVPDGEDPTQVWVYDPASDMWDTSKAPMSMPRDHAAGVALDGKFYVIGGRWRHAGNFASVEMYDPATDAWTRRADMPTARSGFAADVLDGKIHAVGGEDIDAVCTYAQHEVYDPATDTWTALPSLPTPRHGLGAVALDGKLYVIGGGTGSGPRTQFTLTRAVEIFTPDGE